MQGSGNPDPELLDAYALVGHLVAAGNVFAFLAEHRHEVFPSELFADLFPARSDDRACPGNIFWLNNCAYVGAEGRLLF